MQVFNIAIAQADFFQREPGDGVGRRTGAGDADGFAAQIGKSFGRRIAPHPDRHDREVALGGDEHQIAAGQVGGDGRWAAEGTELHGAGNQCLHGNRAAGVNDLDVESVLFE
jgi:hypothetical protein